MIVMLTSHKFYSLIYDAFHSLINIRHIADSDFKRFISLFGSHRQGSTQICVPSVLNLF